MTFKHRARVALQKRLGIDVHRFPGDDGVVDSVELARTVKLLDDFGVTVVVDVGANNGVFASSIREAGYKGRIISFEPLSKPFAELSQTAVRDDRWDVFQFAVGATEEIVTINVAGNAAASSSVLPMLEAHSNAAPHTRYVSREEVSQARLDFLIPEAGVRATDRTFIKVDVQGYEAAVLDGAKALLAESSVVGIQLELSIVPLYEGAMTYREGLDRMDAMGMSLMSISPVFRDPDSGRLLQIDAVFFKV